MPARPRALVYRPGSLGDTLVSLPAIAEIRRQYPSHHLSLLTELIAPESGRVSPWTILKETGWFDDVHYYVVKAATTAECWHNVKLAARLRTVGYDDIFSLAPPRTFLQLKNDARIFRRIVGTRRYHAAARPSWPLSELGDGEIEHESVRLLRIVDPNASESAVGAFRLRVPPCELQTGNQVLKDLGVGEGQVLVAVAPGSRRASTTWPAERFAAVGRALLERFGNLALLAIGGTTERPLCGELCDTWGPRAFNLAGRLSVFGSASVLSKCATCIGNDSGPTHLAASLGVPCVAIYSARNAPGQWSPIGDHHVVIEDRPACAGCMLDDCILERNKCLTGINAARVFREAASVIQARGATVTPA